MMMMMGTKVVAVSKLLAEVWMIAPSPEIEMLAENNRRPKLHEVVGRFLEVMLPDPILIEIESALTKCSTIVCLEASNNPCVQWLNKWRQIGLEEFDRHICRLISNVMARKVIERQADIAVCLAHLQIEHLHPSTTC